MSKVLVTESNLANIANAIRGKNGQATQYKPSEMPAAIAAIPTGVTPTGTVNITQNGTTDVTDYASANVNVPNSYAAGDEGKVVSNGALVAQAARVSQITANGTYDTTLNDEVTVNVSGGGGGPSPHVIQCNALALNSFISTVVNAETAAAAKKLFVMMMDNLEQSSTFANGPFVEVNSTQLQSSHTESHSYESSGTNRRNYRIDVYDLSLVAGDGLSISFSTQYSHASWVYAIVTEDFDINKIMSSVETATSGSDNKGGCVLYGTIDDDTGGTITSADYTKNTTITTNNPGSGYKSSFIIWLAAKGSAALITKNITQNGTYNASSDNADGYSSVTVNVSGGGGTAVTDAMELFIDGGDTSGGPRLVLSRNKTVSGYNVPASIVGFLPYSNGVTGNKTGYRNSLTPTPVSFDLTTAILLENDSDFKSRFQTVESMEYLGYVYGNSAMINALSLVLLADLSQNTASSPSTAVLSDSISNYSAILLQGIYNKTRQSNYNTTKLYVAPSLNVEYWAGMKDRNSSYDCLVTFTSNTEVSLSGNKQVIIYGMP